MEKPRPTWKDAVPALLVGALAGGLFLAFDGAVLGAILGSLREKAFDPLGGALRWAGYLAPAGAVVGGIVGVSARMLGPRMVLQPPSKEDEPVQSP